MIANIWKNNTFKDLHKVEQCFSNTKNFEVLLAKLEIKNCDLPLKFYFAINVNISYRYILYIDI